MNKTLMWVIRRTFPFGLILEVIDRARGLSNEEIQERYGLLRGPK